MNKLAITGLVFILSVTTALARNGVFVNTQFGWSFLQGLPSQAQANAIRLNKNSFPALRFGIGYMHDIYRWLGVGVEVAKGRYAQYRYTLPMDTVKTESTTNEFLLVIMWHLCRQWDIYTKVGGIRHTIKIRFRQLTGPNQSETRNRIEYGGGLGYNINRHVAVTLEGAYTPGMTIGKLSDIGWNAPGITEILAGIRFSFGGFGKTT